MHDSLASYWNTPDLKDEETFKRIKEGLTWPGDYTSPWGIIIHVRSKTDTDTISRPKRSLS